MKLSAVDLRNKTVSELEMLANDIKKDLYDMRFKKVTDVVNSPAEIIIKKRNLARVFTIINEKASSQNEQLDSNLEEK